MIMTFQLKAEESEPQNRTLTFGGGENPLRNLRWNYRGSGPLTNTNLTLPSKDLPAEGEPTISAPFELYLGVESFSVYDQAGFLEMPWFHVVDRVLFRWWNYQVTESIPFRIRVAPEDRTVQIWPDADFWDMVCPRLCILSLIQTGCFHAFLRSTQVPYRHLQPTYQKVTSRSSRSMSRKMAFQDLLSHPILLLLPPPTPFDSFWHAFSSSSPSSVSSSTTTVYSCSSPISSSLSTRWRGAF
jgi:hypothetical protein